MASKNECKISSNQIELSGMKVWLSGGTGGLGEKIAESLVRYGCAALAITDVAPEEKGAHMIERLANLSSSLGSETQLLYFLVDVRNERTIQKSMQAAVDQFGGLDAVVNNAGVFDEDDLNHTMQVNAIGCIRATEIALRIFAQLNTKSQDKQSPNTNSRNLKVILNISSASGVFPLPDGEYYAASKHAIVGYSKSIALRAIEKGVRVVCLCPAWIDIGMGVLAMTQHKEMVGNTGLRIMKASEVTDVVIKVLVSDNLTGDVIFMSGNTDVSLARVKLRKLRYQTSKL